MAGTEDESGSPRGSSFQAAAEEEPRLKYSLLGGESPRAAANGAAPATKLCVSDKVLAVGHRDGSVQLLDHLGNQVGWERSEGGPPLQGGTSGSANPAAAAACVVRPGHASSARQRMPHAAAHRSRF